MVIVLGVKGWRGEEVRKTFLAHRPPRVQLYSSLKRESFTEKSELALARSGSNSALFLFFPPYSECSSEGTLLSRLKKEKVKLGGNPLNLLGLCGRFILLLVFQILP